MEPAPAERQDILVLGSLGPDQARLRGQGDLVVGGQTIHARLEGASVAADAIALVQDPAAGAGRVLHYLCKSQDAADTKARAEHYLHVAPMRRVFVSEFSLKLDAEFTVVETKRPDGGPNWCILHQWHQTAPESPPISLSVKPGTNRVLVWSILYGQSREKDSHRVILGTSAVELDCWYHFRVRWNVDPEVDPDAGHTGTCQVSMSEHGLPKDLGPGDLRFHYDGPIGFSAKSGHKGDNVREQVGIYQGPHLDPGAHHGISIDHMAVYAEPETGP